jgi:hypothetical protein
MLHKLFQLHGQGLRHGHPVILLTGTDYSERINSTC